MSQTIPEGAIPDFVDFVKANYVILSLAGSLIGFAIFVYLIGKCMNKEADNFVMFNFLLICYDMGFDIAFLIKNANDVPGLYRFALIILILSGSINLVSSFATMIYQRICNPLFSNWLKKNHRFASLITIFSVANIQVLKVLSSNYGNMDIFKAKYSANGKRIIAWVGVLNLGFQDIPQLVILVRHRINTTGYTIIPFVSLILNIVILIIDAFGRIYDAVIISPDEDGTTSRLGARSSESSYQYSLRVGAES